MAKAFWYRNNGKIFVRGTDSITHRVDTEPTDCDYMEFSAVQDLTEREINSRRPSGVIEHYTKLDKRKIVEIVPCEVIDFTWKLKSHTDPKTDLDFLWELCGETVVGTAKKVWWVTSQDSAVDIDDLKQSAAFALFEAKPQNKWDIDKALAEWIESVKEEVNERRRQIGNREILNFTNASDDEGVEEPMEEDFQYEISSDSKLIPFDPDDIVNEGAHGRGGKGRGFVGYKRGISKGNITQKPLISEVDCIIDAKEKYPEISQKYLTETRPVGFKTRPFSKIRKNRSMP